MNIGSLDEMAYGLLNKLKPFMVDDEIISLRQVKNWIKDTRATFLRNKLNGIRQDEQELVQVIQRMGMIFDRTEHDGHRVFKSKESLPEIIHTDGGPVIIKVEDGIGSPYKIVRDIRATPYLGYGRFNRYMNFVYLEENHIKVKTRDMIYPMTSNGLLSISAVFADPSQLSKFKDETGKPIYSDKYTKFPITMDIKKYIESEIIQTNFGVAERAVPDEHQDGRSNQGDLSSNRASQAVAARRAARRLQDEEEG